MDNKLKPYAPDYFVLTQIIIDDIYLPDGQEIKGQLGGGVFTAAGMRIWSDSVGICSGIGPGFSGGYDKWFIENGIDVAGVLRQERCTHSRINYFPDGEREEILIPGYGSHRLMQAQFHELPERYVRSKGMYIFKDCEMEFWDGARRYFEGSRMIKVWEIHGAAAEMENKDTVAECLSIMDIFSLNFVEGQRLTGESQPADIVKALHSMHAKTLILRMGANGALASNGKDVYHIPAVSTNVVDVTGGGNSSTGGFLVGYCESGGDIVFAGACAAVSASFMIEQYGVPSIINSGLMEEARQRASRLQIEKL